MPKKLFRYNKLVLAGALAGIIIFAGLGILVLSETRAAGAFISVEPDAGSITAPALKLSDQLASGGSAVRFAPPSSNPNSPSGEAMPVGDLTGWKQVFADDFTTGNVAVGNFPGSYGSKWSVGYGDNAPDTAGKNNGNKSVYYPSKVLSIQNGVMNMFLHSENGQSMGAAPMPKVNKQTWPYNGQLYGKYTVRFKSDPIAGFKTAWLLWPDTGSWNEGEIDFPEGDLDGTIHAFSHCAGPNPASNCISGSTTARYTSWHTASVEWVPGRVTFILDGQSIATGTNGIPTTSMHYVMQTESCFSGISSCPAATAMANLQIDWIAVYTRN